MQSEKSEKHILKINLHPHDALRQVIPESDLKQDLEWDKIADLMHNTMEKADGLGLAANQVSIGARMFTMRSRKTFINPKIIEKSENYTLTEEGCLSFPGIFCKIKRHTEIRARFSDWQNNTDTFKFREVTAQVFQHEYDHLEGITFRQRANSIHWQKAKKEKLKLDRLRKKNEREKRTFI